MAKERKVKISNKYEYYIFQYTENDKKKRKYFKNIFDYRKAKRDYKLLKESRISKFIDSIEDERIDDVINAIKILRNGLSLVDCVNIANNANNNKKDIKEAIKEYLEAKQGKTGESQMRKIKGILTKLGDFIESFENLNAENVIIFANGTDRKPKTQEHYFVSIKGFLKYCETKKYININPFNEIHKTEEPKVERNEISLTSIENMQDFFNELENKAPQYVGLLALVAFGGFRTSEAQKIELENINYEDKSIILGFKKSKTKNNWLQMNMPANVWEWLKKYPPCKDWKDEHFYDKIKKIRDDNKIGNNALRHSFATYHLSLLREAPKTSLLMRHTNPSQLWQTYLEGLTSEEVAKAYFTIVPKA